MHLTILFILIYSITNLAQVIDTKQYAEPKLKEGECYTLSDSKIYLENVKKNTQAVSEIGEAKIDSLKNTDKESYFFCKLKCNLNSETHFVWITQKDDNENFKKLDGFVCSGLEIKDVPVSNTLSIKTTVATPSMSVMSAFPEVHAKLDELNYKIQPTASSELFSTFFESLRAVQKGYSHANAESFLLASVELALYLPENPDHRKLIKEKMLQLECIEKENKLTSINYNSSTDIVNQFFQLNGCFLKYLE